MSNRAIEGGPAQPVYVTNTAAVGGSSVVSQGAAGAAPWPVGQGAAAVTTATLQSAATGTGNGTSLDVSGMAVAVLQTAGTFSGTVTFEASVDDVNWIAIIGENLASGAIALTTTATNLVWGFRVAGLKSLRARISAYTSGAITVTGRAQAVDAQLPIQQAALYSNSGTAIGTGTGASDSNGTGSTALIVQSQSLVYDGSSVYNRLRNNADVTVLASAARTIATNSADIVTYNARYLRVDIDITAVAGTPVLTFTIKAKDVLSGVYTTMLVSAGLVTTGHTVLLVGPGLLASANLVANMPLPRTYRVEVSVGTADSVTYSVGAVQSN